MELRLHSKEIFDEVEIGESETMVEKTLDKLTFALEQ